MTKRLLTFNCGSSSIKVALYDIKNNKAVRLGKGAIDNRRNCFSFFIENGACANALPFAQQHLIEEKLGVVFDWISHTLEIGTIAAIGHRVVHGADIFEKACRVNDVTLDHMESLIPLAPLHQPANLSLIHLIRKMKPQILQTASFDTAFHRDQSDQVRRFALPRSLHNQGIKRYGFHGLSYKYIAASLPKGTQHQKTIVAHLGSGASLCAIKGGKSIETTMSFSTLDGVPMATRSGALDPGVLIHLLRDGKHQVADIEQMLYHSSGLLGMSAISADSRDLLVSDRLEAKQALDVFNHRIAGEVARLCVSLGGIEQLIFTAGIGENQPQIRHAVLQRLEWLGLQCDGKANMANEPVITTHNSAVTARIIATDEEQVIADEALELI